jgi:hypothetical protein
MHRRDFIKVVAGSAATWPLAARAQQTAMPVVAYLSANSSEEGEPRAAAFRRGLQALQTLFAGPRSLRVTPLDTRLLGLGWSTTRLALSFGGAG